MTPLAQSSTRDLEKQDQQVRNESRPSGRLSCFCVLRAIKVSQGWPHRAACPPSHRLDWLGCFERNGPSLWHASPLPLQFPATDRGSTPGSFSPPGLLAHQPPDVDRQRLPIRPLRPRNLGETLASRRLLHLLRQHPRRHSGLS